jgi:four helix bundle protein
MFDHEKLDVYKMAVEFVELADEISDDLPKGRHYLVDQIRRAAASIVLNIAEGAGEYSGPEKARFYRMAKRSTTECAAIIDVFDKLKLIDSNAVRKSKDSLLRIVQMLVKLVQACG